MSLTDHDLRVRAIRRRARVASPDAMYLIAKYLLGTGKRPAREVLPRKAGARRAR